ncbi:TonB-dependent siderophore receptor [Pseudoalteromonas sp. Of7M-16]|uniref:TonB-dependent siderophore receptor n=1 Tax=Pseudoalteromonas sp. Of7M-16 TaxID=2917756 RepID=UPI001EF671E0|nr:TonB-dependent siderophore receptor [Pseudoalteromonas sp. Of7M-16]MCG7550828.1 TonB-dependent siderophore receptor [Pseudoalteromonas sp. Of7M-16]
MKQYSAIAKAVCIGLLASSSSVVLADDAKVNMEHIEVVGKHHRDVGATGLPLAIGDTPQSISIVDSEFMDFHDVNSAGEALVHSAGVYSETSLGNRERFVFSRGFEMNRFLIDGMGAAGRPSQTTLLDTSMFESVEVIRGSTGMLQEVGQPSGTVNLVQKRAYNGTGGAVSAEVGSWNRLRAEADFNTTLNDSGTMRARFVTAVEDADSFVDRANTDRTMFYTTFSADITDALQVSLFASYQDDGQGALSDGLPYQFTTGERVDIGIEANIYPDWATQDTQQDSLLGEARYQINDDWNVVARFHTSNLDDDKVYAGLWWHVEPNGDYALFANEKHVEYQSDRAEIGVNGQFSFLGREHSINFTLANSEFDEYQTTYRPLARPAGNLIAEHTGESPQAKPANPGFNYGAPAVREANIESQSARVAFNLQVLDNLNVLLGANHKDITSSSTNRNITSEFDFKDTSLYYGGVYKFTEQFLMYASYTDIFDQRQTYDKSGKLLDPVSGENKELGFRYSNQEDSLSVDIAYFQIDQENYPVEAGKHEDTSLIYYEAQSGIESEGYEVEISGYVTEQWYAAVSFSDIDMTNPNYISGRVSRVVPDKIASFNTFYDFEDFRIGGYLTYTGEREGFIGERNAEYVPVDSHVLGGFSAQYEINDDLSVKLNIHNLFDKEYDSKVAFYTVRPGTPRNYALELNYNF